MKMNSKFLGEIILNGTIYHQVSTVCITNNISFYSIAKWGALIDHGANGGIEGDDVKVNAKTEHQVDAQGSDNHNINDYLILTAEGVINT